jgi:hypothetical protein
MGSGALVIPGQPRTFLFFWAFCFTLQKCMARKCMRVMIPDCWSVGGVIDICAADSQQLALSKGTAAPNVCSGSPLLRSDVSTHQGKAVQEAPLTAQLAQAISRPKDHSRTLFMPFLSWGTWRLLMPCLPWGTSRFFWIVRLTPDRRTCTAPLGPLYCFQ